MINLWGHSQHGQMGATRHRAAIRLLERSGPGVLYKGLNACNEYRHGLDSAAMIQCPTLMLLGQLDAMTPARVGRKLEKVIPNVHCEVLEDCGHMLMAEKPNQVLDRLIKFLP